LTGGFHLAFLAALFTALVFGTGKPGGFEQPAHQRRVRAQVFGFQGQREKDRLGHILCRMRVAQPAQGTGVHQVGVPLDQLPKRLG
jgi:hypothetical protein